VGAEGFARLGRQGQALGVDSVLLACPGQGVVGEEVDVLAALAQRRQPECDDGQAMVEVFPESLLAHVRLEVRVGRGDDPDVHGLALGRTERADVGILEHPQELPLDLPWQEPHLVEEQGPPVRDLEEPALGLAGIGEGSPLVTEQLRLHEMLGNGRAVELDEAPAGPGAGPVHGEGEQALPGPGIAANEHGREPQQPDVPGHQGPDLLPQGNDARALPEQVPQRIHGSIVIGPTAPGVHWEKVVEPLSRCAVPTGQ
jgi:hypothetical protein